MTKKLSIDLKDARREMAKSYSTLEKTKIGNEEFNSLMCFNAGFNAGIKYAIEKINAQEIDQS